MVIGPAYPWAGTENSFVVATPHPPEATPWFRIGSAADHCVEQHICWLAVSIMFVFTVYII